MTVFKTENGKYSIYKHNGISEEDCFKKARVPVGEGRGYIERDTRTEAEYMLRYICENRLRDKTYKEVTL